MFNSLATSLHGDLVDGRFMDSYPLRVRVRVGFRTVSHKAVYGILIRVNRRGVKRSLRDPIVEMFAGFRNLGWEASEPEGRSLCEPTAMFGAAQTAGLAYPYISPSSHLAQQGASTMPERTAVPIRGSALADTSPDRTNGCAEAVGIKAMLQRGLSRRRSAEPSDMHAGSDSPGDVLLALSVAEEQLRDARRENEFLRISNERLARALADALLRGTEANRLAHYDGLTGLPNRLLLMERLQAGIAEASQRQRQLALLFIDLDGFKAVNDRFGHTAGDKLLTVVATRITACIRATDIACRYGGDEFVVLLSDISDTAIAVRIAEKIRRRICRRYGIEGNEFRVTASIGLALYPSDGEHGDALLSCADASMYRSKAVRSRRHEDGTEAVE
jgi:diguanylate cyclase (GGDEF)-like protein